jgi:hypothetical protein
LLKFNKHLNLPRLKNIFEYKSAVMYKLKKHINIFLLTLCLIGSFQQYPGTNLRGRVLINNGTQVFVAARVDLLFMDQRYPPGQQLRLVASTSTDNYGFYYFSYVIPNNYIIQINQSKGFNIQVIPINYQMYQFQDLPVFYY